MAIHLIDGRAGRDHITSEDIAQLNIALAGVRHGVFDYKESLRASASGASAISVHPGAAIVDGHRFIVTAAEQVPLSAGTSGMKRTDIVYAAHVVESGDVDTGVEHVELRVARGASSASAPSAPSVPSDALKLWRVDFDGVSMQSPVRLFETIPTLDAQRVEKLYENDFWRVVRHGGAVSVFARGIVTESGSESYLDCKYKLPEGLRPATEVLASVVTSGGTAGGYLRAKPDGTITVGQLGGSGSRGLRYGQLTFVPGM